MTDEKKLDLSHALRMEAHGTLVPSPGYDERVTIEVISRTP
jgi:hypothetical protein